MSMALSHVYFLKLLFFRKLGQKNMNDWLRFSVQTKKSLIFWGSIVVERAGNFYAQQETEHDLQLEIHEKL
jgi:hypothetical protein